MSGGAGGAGGGVEAPSWATFRAACVGAGSSSADHEIAAAAGALVTAWGSLDRGYHDLEHLAEVLDRLADLDAATPAAVLAAWFHDAVYAGRPGQDERDSADLARSVLTALGVPADVAERVAALVLVTLDHRPADGDGEAAALCDADLGVLAADPQRYARYAAGVRREYPHVPDAAFAAGRAAVLRDLAARPDLFRTAAGRRLWDAAARSNLAAELDRLDPTPGGTP